METEHLEEEGRIDVTVQEVGRKVAVVTGGTGMVGSAVVLRMMCALGSEWTVYVTSQEEERGREGMKKIALKYMMGMERSGSPPQMKFHQLDMTNEESVLRLRNDILTTYGGLDILINNAALFRVSSSLPTIEHGKAIFDVNFFGTLRVCEALFPLLRNGSRVVNVGSMTGALSLISDPEFQRDLVSPTLTVDELRLYMSSFLEQDVNADDSNYLFLMYSLSKLGVHLLSRVLTRYLPLGGKINTVCPWWCKKSIILTGVPLPNSSISSQVEEVAGMMFHLSTLPPTSPVNGMFFSNEGENECFEKLIRYVREMRERGEM